MPSIIVSTQYIIATQHHLLSRSPMQFDTVTGNLTITGDATATDYSAILYNITYHNK